MDEGDELIKEEESDKAFGMGEVTAIYVNAGSKYSDFDWSSPASNTQPGARHFRSLEWRDSRNTMFRREDSVIESHVRTKLLIPRVLKDVKKAEELTSIYEAIVNHPTLEAPNSKRVRDVLLPPQPDSGTCLEVDAELLGILEEGSFRIAQRENSKVLTRIFWSKPEHDEVQVHAYC